MSSVLERRAEEVAQDPELRETFDLVTARSFARPGSRRRSRAGLVRVDGLLVVSEPPAGEGRWPDAPLARLGFAPAVVVEARGAHYACVRKQEPASAGLPRPAGKLRKRPPW